MLVLDRADEMVNPPMRSMMVDEKMVENTKLDRAVRRRRTAKRGERTYLVASGVGSLFPSGLRITRNTTSKSGTNNEVTNRGIACTCKC